jgi:hypothetical protein
LVRPSFHSYPLRDYSPSVGAADARFTDASRWDRELSSKGPGRIPLPRSSRAAFPKDFYSPNGRYDERVWKLPLSERDFGRVEVSAEGFLFGAMRRLAEYLVGSGQQPEIPTELAPGKLPVTLSGKIALSALTSKPVWRISRRARHDKITKAALTRNRVALPRRPRRSRHD